LSGAFAEAVAIPLRNVTPLPDSVSDTEAVMIEPLANAVHLVSHAPQHAGMYPTAVIYGGGTLGAAILSVCRARGIRVLAVVEINPARGKVAETLGAERVLNPKTQDVPAEILKMTGGRGVSLALDAVGLDATRQGSVACLARGGTALFLGLDQGPSTFDFIDLVRREICLQCSYGYTEKDFAAAFDLVARKVVNFSPWTDMMPLSEGQRAFDKLVKDPGDRLKIALKP
jgi:L-iditol 2-dehydrogenase